MTIGQFIVDQCPFYLSIGVSWDEYWNGDYTRLPYYRKAYALKREETNQYLWLQGVYFLRAIGCILPNSEPYPSAPLPITEDEKVKQEERQRRTEIDNARAYMEATMHNINKKRKEKSEGGGMSG